MSYLSRMLLGGALLFALTADAAALPVCAKNSDEKNPTNPDPKAVQVRWDPTKMPIPVAVYIGKTGAKLPADKTKIIGAVEAALKSYEAVTCSSLKFKYPIEELPAFQQDKDGYLLVFFTDTATSSFMTDAYLSRSQFKSFETGLITSASVGLNSSKYEFSVGTGTTAQWIDIQTILSKILPQALGFYVGTKPGTGSVDGVKFNDISTALTQDYIDGIRAVYFKTDPACTKPAQLPWCGGDPPAGDGVKKDSGTTSGDGGVVKRDGSVVTGDGSVVSGDGKVGGDGSLPLPKKDSGCCAVAPLQASDLPFVAFVGLVLVALLRRRRRP